MGIVLGRQVNDSLVAGVNVGASQLLKRNLLSRDFFDDGGSCDEHVGGLFNLQNEVH